MWQNQRKGKFTASEIYKLFVEPKTIKDRDAGVWSETAHKYIFEKAVETATGWRAEFNSPALNHGVVNELEGFETFEKLTGLGFQLTSTTFYPINDYAGASPDGVLYGESFDVIESVMDIKCPFSPVSFFEQKELFLQSDSDFQGVPKNYFYQLQMQMLATGAKSAYLVRYLTSAFTDSFGNKFEYDIPLENRIFWQVLTADKVVQQQILEKIEKAEQTKQTIINELINEKVNPIAQVVE